MRLLASLIAASIATIVLSAHNRRAELLADLTVPRDEGIIIRDAQGRLVGSLEREGDRSIGREARRMARAARFMRVFKDR
ncbi:hypothetical protein [Azospirillum sp.]|uniref:hypothetical protein n=1 Tax=Azospirillum sp. TaxID=34012 RepID=UPI003D74D656